MLQKNWQELIKPTKLNTKHIGGSRNKVQIVLEPLERGYGHTLGASLRRVLLSSIRGAAVTTVQIDGMLHEFGSIPGVKEDITDIILNIKELAILSHTQDAGRVTLKKTGRGPVTAGDIQCKSDIEIVNKDLIICHLDDDVELNIEMRVEQGKGFVPAERNRRDDLAIGVIAIDSVFNPVKRVAFQVEDTREGKVLDYDKLTLEIETNGTILPEDAVAVGARILQDQLKTFVNFEEPTYEQPKEEVQELDFNVAMLKKVDELELSVRSANCLKNDNIVYIGDLIKKSEAEMLRMPNFGRKSLNEIKEFLAQMGLHLGMEVQSWPPDNIQELIKKFEDKI